MELFTVLVSSKLANLIWSCLDVHVSSTYNTRSAANQSYYIPRARTNYGLYNFRFNDPKIWNSISEDIKQSGLKTFKEKLKREYIYIYR